MYVIGSRRLMPPNALQSKTYCTNPGLQSFLLVPPGVSTRDPSSERRNYLGEKWPVILTESCDFHAYTFEFFYMPQICDVGQKALLPFRRMACRGFFRPERSSGFKLNYFAFLSHILRSQCVSERYILVYRIF